MSHHHVHRIDTAGTLRRHTRERILIGMVEEIRTAQHAKLCIFLVAYLRNIVRGSQQPVQIGRMNRGAALEFSLKV